MTIKKLIYFVLTVGSSVTINSCSSKDTSVVETKPVYKNSKDKFHQTCDNSNKLIFKRYDLGANPKRILDLDKIVWEKTIIDQEKLRTFNNLFAQVKNGGYCCCMKTHYTVTFYKGNTELGLYRIDTTEIKDKIVLFGQSYQTSYIIKLKDLNAIILDK